MMQKIYMRLAAVLCFSLVAMNSLVALEPEAPISKDKTGLALDGYDVVAYFLDVPNKKGSPEWASDYRDATWYFSSEEHKKLFDQEPEKYMPEFGGYCVFAISKKGIAKGAGKYGQVDDGKLYFNADFITQKRYNFNRLRYNKKAEENWAGVKQKISARK